MVRPVRFTRHYTLGLVGGIGFGIFLTCLLVEAQFISTDSTPRRILSAVSILTAAIAQFLYVREMKRLANSQPSQTS